MNTIGAPMVPKRSATAGSLPDISRTRMMPASEHSKPVEAYAGTIVYGAMGCERVQVQPVACVADGANHCECATTWRS